MRGRARYVGLVMAMTGLVACGGSGGSGSGSGTRAPTPSTAPTAVPSAVPTAQLQARLLTAADVGAGWKAGHSINADDLAAVTQLPCEKTISPPVAKRLTAVVGAQFDPVDRSYKHLIELGTTGQPGQLASDLQALFDAIGSCGSTARLTVTKLTIPALGDQRTAYTALQSRSASAATALYARTGYVRVGSVAVMLGLIDFQASAQARSKAGDAEFVRLLETAVAKLTG